MATKCGSRLSKGILEMKFMKRTKAKVDKEEQDTEGREMYSSEITAKMIRGNSNFIIEPSFTRFEELIEGRLSFRGMNPEIERLIELEEAEIRSKQTAIQEIKKEIPDNEMLDFYQKMNDSVHEKYDKFSKKRNAADQNFQGKKKKFMKPEDD